LFTTVIPSVSTVPLQPFQHHADLLCETWVLAAVLLKIQVFALWQCVTHLSSCVMFVKPATYNMLIHFLTPSITCSIRVHDMFLSVCLVTDNITWFYFFYIHTLGTVFFLTSQIYLFKYAIRGCTICCHFEQILCISYVENLHQSCQDSCGPVRPIWRCMTPCRYT
jgi:hypothetical protein